MAAAADERVQSLIIPFAFLIHNQRDTVLDLLDGMQVDGAPALDVLVRTWCENAETFQGLWASRVSTLALMDLFVASFMDGGERLRNVTVKGELVVRAETRNGELSFPMPRSGVHSAAARSV